MRRSGGISGRGESLKGCSMNRFPPLVIEVCMVRARPWGIEKDLEEDGPIRSSKAFPTRALLYLRRDGYLGINFSLRLSSMERWNVFSLGNCESLSSMMLLIVSYFLDDLSE